MTEFVSTNPGISVLIIIVTAICIYDAVVAISNVRIAKHNADAQKFKNQNKL